MILNLSFNQCKMMLHEGLFQQVPFLLDDGSALFILKELSGI